MLGQMLSAGCRGLDVFRALPCCRCLRYGAPHGLRKLPAGADLSGAKCRYDPSAIARRSEAAEIHRRGKERDRSSRLPALASWDLTRLTLAALYYHPNLDIARAKLAEARAGVITARQVPNPSLSFEELSYNASVATPSPWTIAPIINFLIETFGKREYRTAAAHALAEAARGDLATASWQVRGGGRAAPHFGAAAARTPKPARDAA